MRVFELTPEGIKKEKDVDHSQSIALKTGRKLDLTIIVILAITLGYFVWESRLADKPVPPPVVKQADSGAEVATVTPAVNEQSIAVLPFANRSNLDDDLFFTDGIHDDLLTQLAKIQGLKVISRTTMMGYRDTEKSIPEIAGDEQQMLGDKPTNSLAAWESYSRARELIRNAGYNPDTFRAAEPLLEQAVRLDPDFYQAQSRLVETNRR